jgi:hypothetical protein
LMVSVIRTQYPFVQYNPVLRMEMRLSARPLSVLFVFLHAMAVRRSVLTEIKPRLAHGCCPESGQAALAVRCGTLFRFQLPRICALRSLCVVLASMSSHQGQAGRPAILRVSVFLSTSFQPRQQVFQRSSTNDCHRCPG